MNCPQVQEEVAVALATGTSLDPETRRHVSTCPACAAEQASLLGVTTLLATVPATEAAGRPAEPADEVLLQRILTALAGERARERRRARWVRAGAIAAAVLLLVAGIAGVARVLTTTPPSIRASAWAPGIHATAEIAGRDDGSRIDLSVDGLPADADCIVRVYAADGQVETILEWRAEYDGTAHVSGRSSLPPDAITRVTLSEVDGRTLLEIPVTT